MTVSSSLQQHIQSIYGFQIFNSDDAYDKYKESTLSEATLQKLLEVSEPFQFMASIDLDDVIRYSDYTAHQPLAAVIHSQKTRTVIESGVAVDKAIAQADRVLDIGCNIGYLTTWYAQQYPDKEFVGVDISPESIQVATDYANKLKLRNLQFQQRNILETFPAGLFDAIVSTQTFEFLRWTAAQPSGPPNSWLYEELQNILLDDGILVSVPTAPNPGMVENAVEQFYQAGYGLHSFRVLSVQELGDRSLYAVIVASQEAPRKEIDFEHQYAQWIKKC